MKTTSLFVRISCLALGALLVLGGCSQEAESTPEEASPSSPAVASLEGEPTEDPSPSASAEPDEDQPSGAITYEVWFVVGDKLFLEHHSAPSTQAVARLALEDLLRGPQGPEAESGDTTAVPEGTALRGISISDGMATVDLSDEFDSGGGSAGMFLRLAQVVFTLTQFPSVQSVEFEIEGEPVTTFSSEGIVLQGPQTRDDYEEQLPAIVVEEPAIGEEVSGSLTIRGTANVFEATVSIKVIGEKGEVLAEDFTTATCGSGCRGDFEKEIDLDLDRRTTVIVKVFESSAEDGRPTNVVNVPVIVSP